MKRIVSLILSVLIVLVTAVSSNIVFAEETILLGDLNSDGVVDMKDMLLMRKRLAKKITNSDINFTNADVNFDNTLNGIDAMDIINHIVKEKEFATTSVYTMSGLADYMKLNGRAVLDGSNLLLSQTASGFTFEAECGGDIQLALTTAAPGKIALIVDEDYENCTLVDVKNTKTKYTFGADIPEGKHTITILKATEWSHNKLFTINKIIFNGELIKSKPAAKDLKIEFYGDSITSGYGNLTYNGQQGAGDWLYQDGTRTYATFTAKQLNADFAIASASGHGVLGGHSDFTSSYKKFFDYSLIDTKTVFSRTDYDADLIIINFGANDHHRVERQIAGTLQPAFDKVQFAIDFENECSKIIEAMHSDNPDAEILWITGMNYISDTSPVVLSLKNIDEKYDYVQFLHTAPKQNGGDAHPNIADHKFHADNVVKYIKENYASLLPAEE